MRGFRGIFWGNPAFFSERGTEDSSGKLMVVTKCGTIRNPPSTRDSTGTREASKNVTKGFFFFFLSGHIQIYSRLTMYTPEIFNLMVFVMLTEGKVGFIRLMLPLHNVQGVVGAWKGICRSRGILIYIYLTGVDVGEGRTPAVVAEAELNDGRAEEDE